VSVETFFEKPWQMQEQHPELYAALQAYFKQDPASWKRSAAG
jgi:Mlc titration factor MtfA (ptsG expression regulator)